MFKLYTRPFVVLLFIFVFGEIKTSEIPRPRGISLSRLPLYSPDRDFTCLDGSLTIPFLQVNDDYCDCLDGSDEPGTAACPQGTFYCTNAGHRPINIPSSRVNDGICDCCDASDEYAFPNSKCVNNCHELGRSARVEALKKAELLKAGSQIRSELSQKGIQMKQEKKEKLLVLNRSKSEAELIKKEKEMLKQEIEKLENHALEKYRVIEEEQKKLKQDQESEKQRKEALDAFMAFDTNQDGKLEISELQTRPTFDRDRDGEITEQEAQYFLDENTEVAFEEFFNVAWPKIKPYHLTASETFKPPRSGATEADDLAEDYEEAVEETGDTEDHDEEAADHEEEEGDEPDVEDEQELEQPQESISETSIEYDEETNKLIGQASEARKQYNEADRVLKDLQNELTAVQESLEKDYGSDEEFAALEGQCFEYTDREYIYKLCPFDQVTQQAKVGGADTRLGVWGGWAGQTTRYDTMLYSNGASCWNGPQRSTHVHVRCGSESVVTSVTEPNRCEYLFEFTTPAACNPALDKTSEDMHDEL